MHALHVYHSALVTMAACQLRDISDRDHDQTPCLISPPLYEAGGWVMVFRGHQKSVTSVAFSADGKSIVSGSRDRTVRVWDATTGTQQHILTGHEDWVRSVAFSADGKSIVSGSDDGTVRVWDATTGTQQHILTGHEGYVNSVAFSADGKSIVSGSDDRTVRVWDATTGTQQHILTGHEDWVTSVAFSADGSSIVSRSYGKVRYWDAATGIPLDPSNISLATSSNSSSSQDQSFKLDDHGWISRFIMQGTEQRLCWLPVERQGNEIASFGQTVCVGGRTGAITILDFSRVPI
jgi:WD40 repeat protein